MAEQKMDLGAIMETARKQARAALEGANETAETAARAAVEAKEALLELIHQVARPAGVLEIDEIVEITTMTRRDVMHAARSGAAPRTRTKRSEVPVEDAQGQPVSEERAQVAVLDSDDEADPLAGEDPFAGFPDEDPAE